MRILIEVILDEKLEQKLDQKLQEHLRHYPTKEDFFSRMDDLMGEVKTIREEVTLVAYRSSDHTDRIEALEKIHPDGRHPL